MGSREKDFAPAADFVCIPDRYGEIRQKNNNKQRKSTEK